MARVEVLCTVECKDNTIATIYTNNMFRFDCWSVGEKPSHFKIENGLFYYRDNKKQDWSCDYDPENDRSNSDDILLITAIEAEWEKILLA